jgi:hypothetical protein
MEVLESGIEMDPSDLSKVKGGVCACGCDIGWDAESYSDVSVDGTGMCSCGCSGIGTAQFEMGMGASKEFQLP